MVNMFLWSVLYIYFTFLFIRLQQCGIELKRIIYFFHKVLDHRFETINTFKLINQSINQSDNQSSD